jgi:lipopolysaccharide transport system permease protein
MIVFFFYGILPDKASYFLIFALLPLILLTLGCGFILSLLNALFRDISHVVSLAATFLLFVTPILYAEPKSRLFKAINNWNPLSALVNGPRDLVIEGRIQEPLEYVLFSLFSVLFFAFSWRIFHLAESRIAERIGLR